MGRGREIGLLILRVKHHLGAKNKWGEEQLIFVSSKVYIWTGYNRKGRTIKPIQGENVSYTKHIQILNESDKQRFKLDLN